MKVTLYQTKTYDVDVNIDAYCDEFAVEYREWIAGEENDDENRREFVREALYAYMDDFIYDALQGGSPWVTLMDQDYEINVEDIR